VELAGLVAASPWNRLVALDGEAVGALVPLNLAC
jgi:hypothetical protein